MQDDLKATIIKHPQHSIETKQIPKNAQKVLNQLLSNGFQAYLVGGCVRDLLLNHFPKDFDVATDAKPEQVKELFSNCRLIGRRFRLAHIYFKQGIIEVATFRGHNDQSRDVSDSGMILRDNVFGSLAEDAYRRDFTINALYYDLKNNAILDFINGFDDLQHHRIAIIGDPSTRYREDPVRMLRAARFAAKLNMQLTRHTQEPIHQQAVLLEEVSPSRLFDEVIKLFHTGHAQAVLPILFELDLMSVLFPDLTQLINSPRHNNPIFQFLEQACCQTDQRVLNQKGVSCVFLYAVLLWPVFIERYKQAQAMEETEDLLTDIARQTLRRQSWITGIPKRFHGTITSIWRMQFQLVQATPAKVDKLLTKSRFRAGYDLLLLRGNINPSLKPWGKWWYKYQQVTSEKKHKQKLKKIPEPINNFEF